MLKNTEHLFIQRIFRNAIMVIQSGLGSPTDIESGSDMRAGPVEYILNLIPVVHIFEFQVFYGCAGNNHAIVFLVTHQFEITVKRLHVFDGRILGGMTLQLHETHLYL